MTGTDRIARIRISLEDIEPEIWRRVEVPLGLNLKSLHDVIQAAMGWEDCHLFEFTIEDKTYGFPPPGDDFGHKVLQARLAKLETVVARGVTGFLYTYDMGDSWEHRIEIEAVYQGEQGVKYPRFVDGARRCPPEDIGGPPGFEFFVNAVSSPRHREHRRMLEWYGSPYDPDDIDELKLKLWLGAIAKRRHTGKISQKEDAKKR